MKIFNIKNKSSEHVKISRHIEQPYFSRLNQAKGVMENYLRDKNLNIYISRSDLRWGEHDADYLDILGYTPQAQRIIQIKKESDTPFLRKIYKAIEIIAGDFKLNKLI